MSTSTYARRRRQRRRDALSAFVDRQRASGPPGTDPGFWRTTRIGDALSGDLRHPYRQHTWVYAAASWIAQNLASVPFRLYTGAEDEPTDVLGGPWYDLFARPNPEQTKTEFWELSWLYLMLPPGECFWTLHDEMGGLVEGRQPPRWMWAYSGRHFEAVTSQSGALEGWKLRLTNGETVPLRLDQVVHHRIPNPYQPRRGQAPIEAAWRSIRTDEKAQRWNEAFLDNDATPSMAVKLPGMTVEQIKAWKRVHQDQHGGPGNAGKTMVLNHEKSDAKPLGSSHTEMAFIAQREWSRQEVATAYKLPLFVLDVLGDVHRETSREALKLAWESGCLPHARRAESVLDGQLFRGRGAGREMASAMVSDNAVWGTFDFSVVKALQRDENERRELALRDRDLGFPRNEVNARHELGYDTDKPEPDGTKVGDVALVPMALVPLRDTEAELEIEPPEPPMPPGAPPPPPEEEDDADEERAAKQRRWVREKSWRAYIKTVHGPAEKRMASRISRYFYRRRAEVLRWIDANRAWVEAVAWSPPRKGPPSDPTGDTHARTLTPTEFDDWLDAQRSRWDELLADDTRPATEQAIEASYDRLAGQIGKPLSIGMSSPETLRLVEELGARKGRFVNKTMSDVLKEQMREALTGTETIEDITKRIKGVFQGLGTSQARTIARTEVGLATSQANGQAYVAEGIKKHSWLTANDSNVRESHMIDGQVREVGNFFSNGLQYPLDPSGAAEEVINCYLPGTEVGGAFVSGSQARYAGPAREIVTARGHRLRVTANHPILTDQGWLPAHAVRKGSKCLRYRGSVRLVTLSDPDHHQAPSSIEDAFEALVRDGARCLTPVGSLDFHGDARWFKGDVDVVVPDLSLLADFIAEGPELLRHIGFVSSESVDATLEGLGALQQRVEAVGTATASRPRLSELTLRRLAVSTKPLQEFRLRTSAQVDSILLEAAKKCGTADPDGVGDLLRSFPALVATDQVVEVRDFDWRGHVYDLQSTTGAMIAENIISSNCRCTTLPEIE